VRLPARIQKNMIKIKRMRGHDDLRFVSEDSTASEIKTI